jgi:uncharacterized protein
MERKDLIKQLIVTFQESLPVNVLDRDLELPIDSDKIITVPGVRRCGKSSLLFVMMNKLLDKYHITKEHILFLNFDDERLQFDINSFDDIIEAYRELYPDIPLHEAYVFFDEVQMADGWETFVRRLYEQECKHIFITGSNSKMLSSELSTSLRGRCLQYEEFPLSFKEYCRFKDIDTNFYSTTKRAVIVNGFKEYLHNGAFPEVVLSAPLYKDRILQEYFWVMLYRDMVEHYQVKNPLPLRYFIKRVLANLTKPTSINKIFNELKSQGVSVGKNALYDWIEQLQSIYLFMAIPKFEYSLVKENKADNKYYCIDNGLRSVLMNTLSEDNGKLLENTVFLQLRRNADLTTKITYYKGKKECDFVVEEKQEVKALYQVTWTLNDENTSQREIDGIMEAAKATSCSNLYILTMDEERTITSNGFSIKVMPVWKWLLI